MTEQEFYDAVAVVLGVESTYRAFPYSKRTRWNNRTGGNGRFAGRGLVRMFSPTLIQVALIDPRLHGIYSSTDEALAVIFENVNRNVK